MLDHCLEDSVQAGLGSITDIAETHHSLNESLRAFATAEGFSTGPISEYDAATPWMGFQGPQAGEDFVAKTLGAIIDDSPAHMTLLATLEAYLQLNRSPQKTATHLVVHRQTVIQRLKKVEALLEVDLAQTAAIAKLWVATTIHSSMT